MSAYPDSGLRQRGSPWVLLGLGLPTLGVLLGWERFDRHEADARAAREQLAHRAEIVEQNLAAELQATANGLDAVLADLDWLLAQPEGRERLARRLRTLAAAMSGVRTLVVVDAGGDVIASGPDRITGMKFREGERDRTIRDRADPAVLYVSAPFVAPTGAEAMALGRPRLDDRGRFNGYVLAVLDPDCFRVLLGSVLDTPDMRAELFHGDGQPVFSVPAPAGETSSRPGAPPDPEVRHYLESDQHDRVLSGTSTVTGTPRLIALRAVWPQSSRADQPLVVRISRDRSAVFAPWRQESLVRGGLLVLIARLATLDLLAHERRQGAMARLAAARETERTEAEMALRVGEERLRLALDGARMGTWHWDLSTDTAIWSDTCCALFGVPPGTPSSWDRTERARGRARESGNAGGGPHGGPPALRGQAAHHLRPAADGPLHHRSGRSDHRLQPGLGDHPRAHAAGAAPAHL